MEGDEEVQRLRVAARLYNSSVQWVLCRKRLSQVPNIPSKTLMSNDDAVVSYRMHMFEEYLNVLVNHSSIVYSPELVSFLELFDDEFYKLRSVRV